MLSLRQINNMEQFKDFPFNPAVKVGNLGTIIRPNGRKSSLKPDNIGYLNISIYVNGKLTPYKQHRVVAITWIPNPLNLPEVNHKDGIKTNNVVANLNWSTHQDNIIHAHQSGLCANTGRSKGFKHSQETRDKMRNAKLGKHRHGLGGKWI